MLHPRSPFKSTNGTTHIRRLLGACLLAFLFLLTSLPVVPTAMAGRSAHSEYVSSHPADTPAPVPTPTPTEEELKLQEQKRLLELQRDIELAKKAIRDAQPQAAEPAAPPAPTSTPLTGDTTLTDVKLEPEIVSYKAMSEAALRIVTDLRGRLLTSDKSSKPITNLAIYDSQIVNDWRFYQALFPAFKGQAEDFLTAYKDILCGKDSGVDAHFRKKYCENATGAFVTGQKMRSAMFGPAAITEALSVGGNLIKSFVDFASLFRTETKITGTSVTIDEDALVAEVFRALKNSYTDINLYNPNKFPPRTDAAGNSETIKLVGLLFIYKAEAENLIKQQTGSQNQLADQIKAKVKEKADLQAELNEVKKLKQQRDNLTIALGNEHVSAFRRKLWEEIFAVERQLGKLKPQTDLEARIAVLKGEIGPVQDQIDGIDDILKPLKDLNERFQGFANEFVKVGPNGNNALALFIKSEDIDNSMKAANSYWLEIKSVSAGGSNRVRKNLIWFFAGDRRDHSGGVILEYTLYDKTGAVVCSDKLSHYEGYKTPKQIVAKKNPNEKEFKDPVQ